VLSALKVAEDRCNTRKSEKTARVDGDDADDGALSPTIAAVFSFFLFFLDLFKTSSKPLPQLNPQPTRERISSASSTSETSPTPSSTPCPPTSSQTPSSSAG